MENLIESSYDDDSSDDYNLSLDGPTWGNYNRVLWEAEPQVILDNSIIYNPDEHNFRENLISLVEKNDYETIRQIIENEPDMTKYNFIFKDRFILLNYNLVKILLEDNIKIDIDYVMEINCDYQNLNLQAEINFGNNNFPKNINDRSVITLSENYKMIQLLIDYGANVNAKNGIALKLCVENNHYDVVKLLIDNRADVQICNALTESARRGYDKIVKLLLENGADVHVGNDQPLIISSICNRYKIVKLLLEHDADVHAQNDLALRESYQRCYLSIIEILLEYGARFDIPHDVMWYFSFTCFNCKNYLECDHYRTIKLLLENEPIIFENNISVLISIASSGNFEIMKLLIEHGINIHLGDDNTLYISAACGHFQIVKLLLENGAKVDAYDNSNPREMYPILGVASEGGFHDVVKLLLEYGADVHTQNDYAIRSSSSFDVIKLLLEYGANVNARHGRPLINAINFDNYNLAKLLLKNGAIVSTRKKGALVTACNCGNVKIIKLLLDSQNLDLRGCYALCAAAENDNYEAFELLLQYGADPYENDNAALKIAAKKDFHNIIKLVLDDINYLAKNEILEIAIKNNSESVIKLLSV